MNDQAWSSSCVVAYSMWAVSGLLMALSLLVWDTEVSGHLGRMALICCAVATTATVRSYHVASNNIARAAFRLGREGRDAVSPLR